jgi:hypothetical protein
METGISIQLQQLPPPEKLIESVDLPFLAKPSSRNPSFSSG